MDRRAELQVLVNGVFSFFRFRLGTTLGLIFFVAGLAHYRSPEHTPIFGVWSYPFFAVIASATALQAAGIIRSLRIFIRPNRGRDSIPSPATKLLDLALLSWGFAYFLSARDTPINGGRVVDLNLFGSVMPAAALLEWIALMCLLLSAGAAAIPKLRGHTATLGLTVGTILIVTLVGEGIARVKVAIAPATFGFPSYSSDLWTRRYVKLNREGWRDADHAVHREVGTRRLLIVGDSVAFGWGIPRVEDRLGEQLTARLERRTGARWEPLNASRGNSHTLDEIRFMERMAVYMPDVVLLIYVFNDIEYLTPVAQREHPSSFLDGLHLRWLLYRNSYLFQELFVRVRLILYRVQRDDRPDPYRDTFTLSRHLADLTRFIAIASQTGATVRMVPFDPTIVFDHTKRERYLEFVRQARTFGIPTCPLDTAFDGFAYRLLTVNALDRHPNETANFLAADAVADCLTMRTGTVRIQPTVGTDAGKH